MKQALRSLKPCSTAQLEDASALNICQPHRSSQLLPRRHANRDLGGRYMSCCSCYRSSIAGFKCLNRSYAHYVSKLVCPCKVYRAYVVHYRRSGSIQPTQVCRGVPAPISRPFIVGRAIVRRSDELVKAVYEAQEDEDNQKLAEPLG
jgi:hypothetical protein